MYTIVYQIIDQLNIYKYERIPNGGLISYDKNMLNFVFKPKNLKPG